MHGGCNRERHLLKNIITMCSWPCGVEETKVSLEDGEWKLWLPLLFPFQPHHTLSGPLLILHPRYIYFHSFRLGRLLQNKFSFLLWKSEGHLVLGTSPFQLSLRAWLASPHSPPQGGLISRAALLPVCRWVSRNIWPQRLMFCSGCELY